MDDLRDLHIESLKSKGLPIADPVPSDEYIAAIAKRTVESHRAETGEIIDEESVVNEITQILKGEEGKLPMESVLQGLAMQVENALDGQGVKLRKRIYVTSKPDPSINATAEKVVPDGVIIAVNTGVMMAVYKAIKIIMLSMHFMKVDGAGNPIPDSEFGAPGWTPEELTTEVGAIIWAYLKGGDCTLARQFAPLAGYRGHMHDKYVRLTELFILGHEYAHVALGHVDWSVGRDADDEYAADMFAVKMLMRGAAYTGQYQTEPNMCIDSSLFLFRFLVLMDRVNTEVFGGKPNIGFPPNNERCNHIRDAAAKDYPSALEQPLFLNAFLDGYTEAVIDRIKLGEATRIQQEAEGGTGSPD